MLLRIGRLLRMTGREILVLWYACRHSATPRGLKLAALVLGLYVFSPLDLVPDWLVLLGIVDDVTLLALGIPMLLRFVPEPALQQAHAAADARLSRMPFGLDRF